MRELPVELYRAAQVRELDRIAIEERGIPGYTLMGRAGEAAFELLRQRWPQARRIAVVCGGGNNGGDGYVVARLARKAGLDVLVLTLADPDGLRGAAQTAWRDARDADVPTTIFTALGIGGLAVSLGMKDTIANIIGGFGLMLGRVIQPGDLVNVAGTDGVVEDINWRQTVVRERNGNVKIIPNSILNTASLEKLNPSNEMLVRVPFTAKAGTDIDEMTRQVVQAVQRDTADLADPRFPPKVRLTGYSPYGINVEVCAYAKPESLLPDMINAVARSIANADFLENRAINKES